MVSILHPEHRALKELLGEPDGLDAVQNRGSQEARRGNFGGASGQIESTLIRRRREALLALSELQGSSGQGSVQHQSEATAPQTAGMIHQQSPQKAAHKKPDLHTSFIHACRSASLDLRSTVLDFRSSADWRGFSMNSNPYITPSALGRYLILLALWSRD